MGVLIRSLKAEVRQTSQHLYTIHLYACLNLSYGHKYAPLGRDYDFAHVAWS
jgi:hypothetical protein